MSADDTSAALTAALNKVIMSANEEMRGAYASLIRTSQAFGNRPEAILGARKLAAYAPSDPAIDEVAPFLRQPYDSILRVVNTCLAEVGKGSSDSKLLATLAHCHLMLGDYPNAYVWYTRALSAEGPNDGYRWLGAGVVCHHLKLFEDANQIYQQVLRFEAMASFASDVMLRLAFVQRSLGQFDECLATLMRVQQCIPRGLSEDDVKFHIAFTYQVAGQSRYACSVYQDLFQKHPRCLPVVQQYLWFLSLQVDGLWWKLACETIERLPPEQRADPLIAFTDARLSMKTQDMTTSYHKYCACHARWSSCPIFWCGLGVLYVKNEQFGDAVVAYDYALKLKQDIYEAWANLGYLCELQGDYASAIKRYQTGIERCGNLQIFCERIARLNSKRGMEVGMAPWGLIEVDESRYFTQPAELIAQEIVDSTPKIPFSELTGVEMDASVAELLSPPLKSIMT